MIKYLTVIEAAEIANVHPNTIKNWIKAGLLKGCRPGRDLRIKKQDLDNFFVKASPSTEDYEKEKADKFAKRQ